MNKKKILAGFLDRLKMFDIISRYNKRNFLVFNYHRLFQGQLQTKFDDAVFEYSSEKFEKHLKLIKNNFDVLSEDEVVSLSVDGKIPKRCALITFDDGYIDNYNLAFPLLKSYNLPAIFFIPSDIIEKRYLGWWDITSYLIKKSKKKEININSIQTPIISDDQKRSAVESVLQLFKTTPYEKTQNLIETIAEICEVELPSSAEQSAQLMTWEQLNEIRKHNIAIGSHTHTHRVLSTLMEDEQLIELKKSKKVLEKKLGCEINSLSYPVGGYSHFSNETKKIAENAGYKICFSYHTGFNTNKFDQFDIKRIGIADDLNIIKGQFFLPSIFI